MANKNPTDLCFYGHVMVSNYGHLALSLWRGDNAILSRFVAASMMQSDNTTKRHFTATLITKYPFATLSPCGVATLSPCGVVTLSPRHQFVHSDAFAFQKSLNCTIIDFMNIKEALKQKLLICVCCTDNAELSATRGTRRVRSVQRLSAHRWSRLSSRWRWLPYR